MHERVDICSTRSTPDNGAALNDGKVREILEGMDENTQRQSRFLQQGFRFRDLGQSASENICGAVDGIPGLGLKLGAGRLGLLRGQDMSVGEQVNRLHSPHLLEA